MKVCWLSAGVSSFIAGYLDELDPNRGHATKEVMPDCGIMCEIITNPS